GINAMLTSILYRATPDDVRLIMIDPKRLELGMYEDIPHLMTPVVVDAKQAANALRWAVREMEERYKTLAAEGVRNIEQYNRNIHQAILEKRTPPDGEPLRPLPFIIVVIDELADLMMVASSEVEQSIARLASFLRKQGKPTYDETITAEEKTAADAIEMEKDDLYDEAARIVVQSGQASISYLQRRLRIGFSRAARLVDMMEMEGLVSPAAGGKPREVLVDKAYFDEVDAQLR